MFVAYHLSIGVDQIILFFSDPEDAAIVPLSAQSRVTCVCCNVDYWKQQNMPDPWAISLSERQIINANAGLAIAQARGTDWIIHIDGDELVYVEGDLKQILARQTCDVLRFEPNEAVPQREQYAEAFEPKLFKRPTSPGKVLLAKLLGCRNAFYRGEYFRGHSRSKVAVRTQAKLKRMGNHIPEEWPDQPLTLVATDEVKLLHYDCVGLEAWQEKWAQRLDGSITVDMRTNRNRQLEDFGRALAGGDRDLSRWYRRIYFISAYERWVLSKLGLLTTVEIERVRFEVTELLEAVAQS